MRIRLVISKQVIYQRQMTVDMPFIKTVKIKVPISDLEDSQITRKVRNEIYKKHSLLAIVKILSEPVNPVP